MLARSALSDLLVKEEEKKYVTVLAPFFNFRGTKYSWRMAQPYKKRVDLFFFAPTYIGEETIIQ
eukprot:CAMPEP_0170487110 /NCGR_PEP_ID=MMETSP0208-20121228/5980_1 /TAXON_ID=197538 /ORGANISM="Strombidium inclinatum, Strain S3" /LENGTH=63 /DNA_ID=CAMNT_0010761277 /DNA_START=889 /DNA_END=1080 /DNA_ORIENTATION=-